MSDESTPRATQPSEMELLRTEMRAGFQSVAKRFDDVDKRLGDVDKRLDGHDERFVSLDTRITTEAEATRRHFDVVAEGLRESFKGVIDKTVATGKKVDRLIASNAVEHAAFLDVVTDHEVRITRLEGTAGQHPKSRARNRQT
jgi:hypothetical protein